jgi:hypothetical protein|tara:strand:+ start:177 stop:716 length:540 start_codon:yes stop_codon:yes gene_type:complete
MSENIIKDVTDWIKNFVEVPHPLWGNLPPCPYARQARVESGKLAIRVQDQRGYFFFIENQIEIFKEGEFDVIVAVANKWINPNKYTRFIDQMNRELDEIVLLTDHPDILENNNGVNVQQGEHVLTFIQNGKILEQSSKFLHETTDYYDKWDSDFYKTVVLDRYKTLHSGEPFPEWMKQK